MPAIPPLSPGVVDFFSPLDAVVWRWKCLDTLQQDLAGLGAPELAAGYPVGPGVEQPVMDRGLVAPPASTTTVAPVA